MKKKNIIQNKSCQNDNFGSFSVKHWIVDRTGKLYTYPVTWMTASKNINFKLQGTVQTHVWTL